jgi:hypothetical protein
MAMEAARKMQVFTKNCYSCSCSNAVKIISNTSGLHCSKIITSAVNNVLDEIDLMKMTVRA